MTEQTGFERKEVAATTFRHRAHFALGVIMVPALEPRRRATQRSALERQLELLRIAAGRQAAMPRLV